MRSFKTHLITEGGMKPSGEDLFKRNNKMDFIRKAQSGQLLDVDGNTLTVKNSAAMNDLLRPALCSAWQRIIETAPGSAETLVYDVVGPVCETGDFLGKDRELGINEGDLLAVLGAGAYSFTMSSNYNSRPRAAEILVSGTDAHVIRKRERVEDLWVDECLPEHIGSQAHDD